MKHLEEYEGAFFPIYQAYLKENGLGTTSRSPVEIALRIILSDGGFAKPVFPNDAGQNPLLITSKSFAQLSQSAKTSSKFYWVSGRGLIYKSFDENVADQGRESRKEIRVRDYTVPAPTFLLRGQRSRVTPTSPLFRAIRTPPPSADIRFPHYIIHTSLLLYLFMSLISDFDTDAEGNEVPIVVPSPFHLLLWKGGLDDSAAREYCAYVTDVLRIQTLNALKERERRIYVAHLTDYEMPVPIVTILGFPQDYVPNPFVSMTTSISIALLYASGYYVEHSDKFNVDWKRVGDLCVDQRTENGFIYVISSKRWSLPMTEIAGSETIGAKEDEFGLPSAVLDDEIVNVFPVSKLVQKLGVEGLHNLLTKHIDANSDEGKRLLSSIGC